MQPANATLHLHKTSREVFSSFLSYKYHDEIAGDITGINIAVNYDPFLPYPVWLPSDSDQVVSPLEPIFDLPKVGIKLHSALGAIFQWVEANALYSIYLEGLLSDKLQSEMPKILKRIGE